MKNYRYPPGFSFFTTYKRAIKLVSNPIDGMNESMARFGETYSVYSGLTRRIILTSDPELIDYVLRKNQKNYFKSRMVSRKLGRFLGNGLLTSNGPYWLRQRRLIQPGFHIQKVQGLYGIMEGATKKFLEKIPTGQAIDMLPLMNRFAFEIVIKTLFDIEIGDQAMAELGSFITDIQEFVVRDIRQPHKSWWHKLSGEVKRNLKRAEHARGILRSIIQQRKTMTTPFNDLLDMLLTSRYEDSGQPMDEEQIIDEILILIIAGHETTANALTWTLWLLATHPDQLERLRETTRDSALNATVINPYLNAVISESMRLYPPAWVSDRVALHADEFKEFSWPEGTIIILLYYAVHRDKRWWPDADVFSPDRFMLSATASTKSTDEKVKAYFPFGGGPRLCIGNNFAMAEMAIFLRSFIHQFTPVATETIPKMKPQVTLRPEGVVLRIERFGVGG